MVAKRETSRDRRRARSPESIVREFVRQINRHDVDRVTQLMTNRHTFIDSLGHRLAGGRHRMRAAWAGYFQMVPDYRIRANAMFVQRDTVFVVGTASGSYVSPTTSRRIGRWRTPAAWRAVVRGGHVAEWQVYADNEPVRNLMRQALE